MPTPALAVNGTTIPVVRLSATEDQPEVMGSSSRSASGTTRGSRIAEKRAWTFSTPPLPIDESEALEVALGDTLIADCSGTLLGTPDGVTIECLVEIDAFGHSRDGATGDLLRAIRFRLTEV